MSFTMSANALNARQAMAGTRLQAGPATRAAAARPVVTSAAAAQKIRIKLRSYKVEPLQESCAKILSAATETGANGVGPVMLPTRKRKFIVLRSPHVNKDSREAFEIRTHQRLIDINDPSAQTIDALMQLDLPAGVDIEVKL